MGNFLKGRNVKGRQDNLKGKPIQFVLNYFYIATFIVIETASRNPAYF